MKRKECKAAMGSVAMAAHGLDGQFSICNPSTDEVIEFDIRMVLHIVSATLAWSHELIDGKFDGSIDSPVGEVNHILRAAAMAYVNELDGGRDGVDSES